MPLPQSKQDTTKAQSRTRQWGWSPEDGVRRENKAPGAQLGGSQKCTEAKQSSSSCPVLTSSPHSLSHVPSEVRGPALDQVLYISAVFSDTRDISETLE